MLGRNSGACVQIVVTKQHGCNTFTRYNNMLQCFNWKYNMCFCGTLCSDSSIKL